MADSVTESEGVDAPQNAASAEPSDSGAPEETVDDAAPEDIADHAAPEETVHDGASDESEDVALDVPSEDLVSTVERDLAIAAIVAAAPPAPALPPAAPTHASADQQTAQYAWVAPAAPRPKRRPMWMGLAAGTALVALIAASLVLIAPGTSVAGVGIGGLTQGAAAGALQQRLDDTTIVLTGDGGGAVVTGADLGATVDADKLAKEAFASKPMWNPTRWLSASVDAPVRVDPAKAAAALQKAAPKLSVAPVDAALAYDAATATYVTTPGKQGTGVDVTAVQAALQKAYDSGQTRVEVKPALSPVAPATTTEAVASTAKSLNTILGTAGFYVGKVRAVPVDRATAAAWLSVTRNPDGSYHVTADKDAIQTVVETLPTKIDRTAVNATVITDSQGKVLKTLKAGAAGWILGDTSTVAADYATQLANGKAAYALPVAVQEFTTTKLARRIEVNITQQHAYLYENGKVVYSYPISSGLVGHDTNLGHYRIYAKVALQDMGDPKLIKADYFTPNVPWISYFDGDEALHGAYWHHNFGHRMSHGCVNMPIPAAKLVYTWAPIGTEVWVHM
jgi:lipoprotein-anchoring transpeptidase ErfK/SrfK